MSLRRPLTGVAAAVILGICCGASFPLPLLAPLCAAAATLAASLLFHIAARRTEPKTLPIGHMASLFLYLAIFFSAWFGLSLDVDGPSGREIGALMRKPREGVELCGTVCSDPVMFARRQARGEYCLFDLDAACLHRAAHWEKARGRLRVSLVMAEGSAPPAYGDQLLLSGALTDRHAANDIMPDGRPRYFLRTSSSGCILLSRGHGNRLVKWCLDLRESASKSLGIGISHRPDVTALLRAMLLGSRQGLDEGLESDFRTTGAYHVLAISGLHAAIFAAFIIAILCALGVSRTHWFIFLAPCLLVFMLATGMRASTVRGSVMALLLFLGPLVNRKTDIISAMALAALLILSADPAQLFDRGFILSFTVIAGLSALCPGLFARAERWTAPDPARHQPERALVVHGRRFARIALSILATSLAAWLAAAPLVARWFNMITPAAPLSNLVIVPSIPLILLAGWLSVFFGSWLPCAAEIFNFANVVLVSALTKFIHVIATLPFSFFFVKAPPVWSILLWYAALLGLSLKKKSIWIPIAGCLGVAAAAALIASMQTVGFEVLNAGGKAVCLIDVPGGRDLLVDTGSRMNGPGVERWLRSHGVDRLDALVLTRADAAHAGGAERLIGSIPARELWCAATNMRSSVFMNALGLAEEKGLAIRQLARGNSGRLRANVEWTVLHPKPSKRFGSAAEAGMALLFRRGTSSILIGGELPLSDAVLSEDEGTIGVLIAELPAVIPEDEDDDPGPDRFKLRILCVSRHHPEWTPRPGPRREVSGGDLILRPGQAARVRLSTCHAEVLQPAP